MAEWRLFPEGTVPEYTTAAWYATRERAPHLEQEVHRARLLRSAALVGDAARAYRLRTVVDLGAGDGGLLSLLGPALTAWGYDLAASAVAGGAERGVDIRLGDVVTGDISWGQIAVATEMLEHLVDPHAFVRRIAEHSEVLVCSSPRLETGDFHYEFHTWAWDFTGYRALVEQAGFEVRVHEPVEAFQVMMAVQR